MSSIQPFQITLINALKTNGIQFISKEEIEKGDDTKFWKTNFLPKLLINEMSETISSLPFKNIKLLNPAVLLEQQNNILTSNDLKSKFYNIYIKLDSDEAERVNHLWKLIWAYDQEEQITKIIESQNGWQNFGLLADTAKKIQCYYLTEVFNNHLKNRLDYCKSDIAYIVTDLECLMPLNSLADSKFYIYEQLCTVARKLWITEKQNGSNDSPLQKRVLELFRQKGNLELNSETLPFPLSRIQRMSIKDLTLKHSDDNNYYSPLVSVHSIESLKINDFQSDGYDYFSKINGLKHLTIETYCYNTRYRETEDTIRTFNNLYLCKELETLVWRSGEHNASGKTKFDLAQLKIKKMTLDMKYVHSSHTDNLFRDHKENEALKNEWIKNWPRKPNTSYLFIFDTNGKDTLNWNVINSEET